MLIGVLCASREIERLVLEHLNKTLGFKLLNANNSDNIDVDHKDTLSSSSNFDKLLKEATANWQVNQVFSLLPERERLLNDQSDDKDACDDDDLTVVLMDRINSFKKRPFFIALGVDSRSDHEMPNISWSAVFTRVHVLISIRQASNNKSDNHKQYNWSPLIESISNLLQERPEKSTLSELLRPSWDVYFLKLAHLASQRSNCMKRRVGAILVNSSQHVVISTGYNGTPRNLVNCNAGGCARCNEVVAASSSKGAMVASAAGVNLEGCLCLHAEENALLEAGRTRLVGAGNSTENRPFTLYCCTCPCLSCTKKIVQMSVIGRVVFVKHYNINNNSSRNCGNLNTVIDDEYSKGVLKSAGIVVDQMPDLNEHFESSVKVLLVKVFK